eukprot:UN25212
MCVCGQRFLFFFRVTEQTEKLKVSSTGKIPIGIFLLKLKVSSKGENLLFCSNSKSPVQ